jgi:uridine kinase
VQPFIIGITGGSGSGKTSFINNLKKNFSSHQVCVISQDDYYRPRESQTIDSEGITNFDLPESIFKEDLFRDLCKLKSGEPVLREEYTFNNPSVKPKVLHFSPAPILIVEGLFILYFEEIRKMLDLSLFIQAKDNLKVIRRIRRDQTERNYPINDVLYRYENHVMPAYEKYIKPFADDVDIIINNNRHFNQALQVVVGFISNYLHKG